MSLTIEEARALVEQRLVRCKYLPALTGVNLKDIAKSWTDNDWDSLASAVKSGDIQACESLFMGLIIDKLATLASNEVQGWVDNNCVPPIRLTDLLVDC